MATIIAGRFEQQSDVDSAIEELTRKGFARDRIASFYVNPAGQHAKYPIGGDEAISPGAKESGKGAQIGVAAGAVVGMAATSFLGPLGLITGGLVGAYVGGLVGGLSKMKEQGDTGPHQEDPENALPVRHAGLMVAIEAADQAHADRLFEILLAAGAADIERAEGNIVNGNWADFDPVTHPALIRAVPAASPATAPYQHG